MKLTWADARDALLCLVIIASYAWWRGGDTEAHLISVLQATFMLVLGFMLFEWFLPMVLSKRAIDWMLRRK